jgi:HD-GYP domain-containing protein (c-di-GMP phosphodiesterase class II)
VSVDAFSHAEPSPRSVDLDPVENAAIEARRVRVVGRLGGRDRWATLSIGAAFLAASGAFALVHDSARSPSLLLVAALVAAYAILFHVEFEIGSGHAVPTQLVLVPMLFLLPLDSVPVAVAAGIIVASLVEHAEGRLHFERLLLRLVYSWHAVGPALVLALAAERGPRLADLPLYLGALAAQFALEFASSAGREYLGLGVPPQVLARYLSRTWLVDTALAPIGFLGAMAAVDQPYAFLLLLPLVALLQVFSRERRARIDGALELSHAYRGTAFLLGDVVEADDAYTGSHSRDVVDLVLAVADELGLDARDRRDAEFVALLHDVGKIRIPAEIINKPAKLTPEEREVIEQHTIEGERMLVQVGGVLGGVGRLVRSCHEHVDGGGYPDGLVGEEIPLVARIVCCCDAFSAMTTDRPYRAARSAEESLAELRRCAGTQFDADVVEALARTL